MQSCAAQSDDTGMSSSWLEDGEVRCAVLEGVGFESCLEPAVCLVVTFSPL
jgi:hypothetical protein